MKSYCQVYRSEVFSRSTWLTSLILFLTVRLFAQQPDAVALAEGQKVYMATCNTCHKADAGVGAPAHLVLAQMPPRAILAALETGKMRVQANGLTSEQRKAVAQWLTGKVITETAIPKEAYAIFKLTASEKPTVHHSGWGGDLEGTGYRSAQQAGMSAENVGKLKLKWAFAFPEANQVRSKPAIVGDWLIVGSQFGEVYCLNKQTGKIGWRFLAKSAIRGAISVVQTGKTIHAFFADNNTNVYALDVTTGKLLWENKTGKHPQSGNTGSVAVHDNRIYVPLTSIEVASVLDPAYPCCSSSGEIVALDARSGTEIWRHRVITDEAKEVGKKKNGSPFYGPSGAIIWSSPTVDTKRGLLYYGTGENYTTPATTTSDAIQAVDLKTGKLAWSFQATKDDTWNLACPGNPNCPEKVGPDYDFGMAPILAKQPNGYDLLVVGQKAGIVYGLSPDDGNVIWQTRIGHGGALGGIHWGMATDGKLVYAANADNKYGINPKVDSLIKPAPGLFAIDIMTGNVVWNTPAPSCEGKKGCIEANSAAPTVIPGVVFAGTLDGHLRAYSTKDGKILWDYDTDKPYQTVNGIEGKGGSIDGPSPVVSDGMLFVNSGYGMFGEIPGNVLLAFELEK
ncbi:outer membrane protein assembly factor BamB family protein [Spirosoma validum]|uniref:PQQ-binding-like beta-propeller repeat protein n=1 Tax=Spirosoma validum TaxID=2771355 RepID=A0A927B9F8_9BACT|nr:PQQ-binding-like beta-propeller repeat protein [Spirosoma validum]MBD2757668.1 PQQ-binding-like beta-propeller repeat protein [Spirosoma validum]